MDKDGSHLVFHTNIVAGKYKIKCYIIVEGNMIACIKTVCCSHFRISTLIDTDGAATRMIFLYCFLWTLTSNKKQT